MKKFQFKTLNLSNDFIEHFNGWMLGDGTLSNIKKSKHSASLQITNVNEDYINYVSKIFDKENIEYSISRVKGNFNGSKLSYRIETKFYVTFSELEKRWYEYDFELKRKKIIPTDLELKDNTILQWFLGDGYLTNLKLKPQRIMFCTDRYNIDEVNMLKDLLSNYYGITVQIADRNRLRIPKKDIKKFTLKLLECPVESFKYKWNSLYMI